MQKITLRITGMSCDHCLRGVSRALESTPGVRVESVEMGRATVSYDETSIDPAAIEQAITDAGYAASVA